MIFMQERAVKARSKAKPKYIIIFGVMVLLIFAICYVVYANSVAFEYSMHKVNADMYFTVKHNGKITFSIGERNSKEVHIGENFFREIYNTFQYKLDKNDYKEAMKAVKYIVSYDVPEDIYKELYLHTKDVAYFDGLRYRGRNYCVDEWGVTLYYNDTEIPGNEIYAASCTIKNILLNAVYEDGWIPKKQNT